MDTAYRQRWIQYWMRRAGRGYKGRIATWMASIFAPPYKDARFLSIMNPAGYISPHSTIGKKGIEFGKHVFIDDRVTIFRAPNGGSITLGDRVAVLRDSIIETELDGKIRIGSGTWIHQKCNLSAAMSDIAIGEDVMVAANCSFYPHNHSIEPDIPVARQPLYSLGPIVIGDNAWIGTGVIILSGVTIGEGAVIGAGAVVTKSIPANAVALGVPARVVKMR